MLDAEQSCKRRGEPLLSDSHRHSQSVRRIGERNVEFVGREPRGERESVATIHRCLGLGAHQIYVALQRREAAGGELHENGFACAARQGFQSERAGTRK